MKITMAFSFCAYFPRYGLPKIGQGLQHLLRPYRERTYFRNRRPSGPLPAKFGLKSTILPPLYLGRPR